MVAMQIFRFANMKKLNYTLSYKNMTNLKSIIYFLC